MDYGFQIAQRALRHSHFAVLFTLLITSFIAIYSVVIKTFYFLNQTLFINLILSYALLHLIVRLGL